MATNLFKKEKEYIESIPYKRQYWDKFDYSILEHIIIRKKHGMGKKTYADCIIMADTETSKPHDHIDKHDNHIVCWSLSIRAFKKNIVTLIGRKPSDFAKMLLKIREHIRSDEIYLYIFNLPYDWVFLRKFLFVEMGHPETQLNVKPLYPLDLKFKNGFIFKDALMLAQKKLEKWANDLDVEHKKAVGSWDYLKIRDQNTDLSDDEWTYSEFDTLAGVECIDKMLEMLGKTISSIPLTATGIVRNDCRDISKANHSRDKWFLKLQPAEYSMQLIFENLFTGGFTHNNRYYIYEINPAECKDIASSYPFNSLAQKFPGEKFFKWDNRGNEITPDIVFKNSDYAFVLKMTAINVRLKNPRDPMPFLSKAKSQVVVNDVLDNGRILKCDLVETYYNEIDLKMFCDRYKYDKIIISDCYVSFKEYLPKWLRDYIFERFRLKTELKGIDPLNYMLEKGKLNSCAFGMLAQQPVKPEIVEDYTTGVYDFSDEFDPVKAYDKYLKNYNSFLPYPIAPWITSYARQQLFKLGDCVADDGIWLYSDTDSVYATKFDEKKIEAYNDECIKMIKDAGYHGIEFNGRVYNLGVAEDDGHYSEFTGLHSKCYCKRDADSGELKITVAGVPKSGAKCLNDDMKNFKVGFCFDGKTTGKKQHEYIVVPEIYIDEYGNEVGDSIDLTECDYIVGDANVPELAEILEAEVNIIDYGF